MVRKLGAIVLVLLAAAGCVCGLLLLIGGIFVEQGRLGNITSGAVIAIVSIRLGRYFWRLRLPPDALQHASTGSSRNPADP